MYCCQRCGIKGNFTNLQAYFLPPDPHGEIYNEFHAQSIRLLLKTTKAYNYLEERGFSEDSIGRFRYGYSDERLYNKLLKTFSKEDLAAAGLWILNPDKGYDFGYFNERIIIPYMKGGRYSTFQGRDVTGTAKKRYVFLPRKDPCLYHAEDLSKRGKVWLTEGAFKRDRLAQEGAHSVGLPGASQFKKFLPELRQCEDLWIVLDTDENEVGQKAALEIVKSLKTATIVTLPLRPGEEKIGVDDFIAEYGYEALSNLKSVRYESGIATKPTSLSTLVSDWKAKVESHEGKLGFQTGHKRFDNWLEGWHEGSLTFIAGSPHMGKSSFLEDSATRVYHNYPEATVDYYSNDDSLFTTITRWVAKIGQLQIKDCRYPRVAFAERPDEMNRFEAAAKKLSLMSDRLKILDRSYNISLERLRQDLVAWRKENPKAEKIVFIDAFTKTKTNRDEDFRDEITRSIYKGSLLKEIAQESHVPIIVTHEVPKIGPRRPNSWNLRGSNTLEYDADVILLCYQEAHVKGIQHSSIKIEYEDQPDNPVTEVIIAKDKLCGTPRTTDLFEYNKMTSRFKELDDSDYLYLMQKVRDSERNEWKN